MFGSSHGGATDPIQFWLENKVKVYPLSIFAENLSPLALGVWKLLSLQL